VTTQPKALWLAYLLDVDPRSKAHHDEAAAELRRQHAEIKRLRYENEAWETAVRNCLAMSNGQESEWGLRAQSAFTILHNAIARAEEVKP
jgi:hypothetical protein